MVHQCLILCLFNKDHSYLLSIFHLWVSVPTHCLIMQNYTKFVSEEAANRWLFDGFIDEKKLIEFFSDFAVVLASIVVLSVGSNGQVFATSAIRWDKIQRGTWHFSKQWVNLTTCCTCRHPTICFLSFCPSLFLSHSPLPCLLVQLIFRSFCGLYSLQLFNSFLILSSYTSPSSISSFAVYPLHHASFSWLLCSCVKCGCIKHSVDINIVV